MSSIAHPATPHDTWGTSRNSHAYQQEAVTPPPALVEQFYDEAKRQIVTGDYLRRKWLPIAGPKFYVLIKALRAHCSYEIKAGEAMCYPSETTLAQECGVSRRTLLYWFQRSPEGRFARKVARADGAVRWEEWDWSALNAFLRIVPKRRYDPVGQRSLKAANRYFIRMDDPPVPEDEPLIWEKARELAAQYLAQEQERQAGERERDPHQGQETKKQEQATRHQEQERQAQAQQQEATATRAISFDPADCTLNNVQKLHAQQCAKTAHDLLSLTPLPNTDIYRTMGERQPNGDEAERGMGGDKKTLVGGEPGSGSERQQTGREGYQGIGPAPRSNKRAEKKQPTDFDRALLQAERMAGGVLYDLMRSAQARAPIVGMRTVLIALVNAGAPQEKLLDLVELGRNRVRRFRARGGRIQTTLAGYFITVMRNLATEAREKGWDTARMELEDDIAHQEALWRSRTRRAAAEAQEAAPIEAEQDAPGEMQQDAPGEASATPEMTGDEEETTPATAVAPEPEDAGESGEASEEAERYARMPMDPQARQIWQSALERIRPKISASAFTTWFSGTQGLGFEEEALVVRVGSSFGQQHLEQRFSDLIGSAVSEQRGTRTETRLIVLPDTQEDD